MGWESAITAVFSFLLFIGEIWVSNQPEREKEERNDAIQQGREDIASGDVVAVNNRVDKLLSEPSDSTGQPSGKVTAERIGAVVGVADSG
jgi:hypothetical protein